MIEWSSLPIGISGCRWHGRIKLRPIVISGCRWHGRMKLRPTGISGCRWHDGMKLLTHWYPRMQVVWQNEASEPLVYNQYTCGMIEWICWPIGISGCRWRGRMKLRPIGISGCRWYDGMKLLTHWYPRMQVVWQNEASDPLVYNQDTCGMIEWICWPIGISGCRWRGRMKLRPIRKSGCMWHDEAIDPLVSQDAGDMIAETRHYHVRIT
jgi:nitrous oxide reductase accessory protein NosL